MATVFYSFIFPIFKVNQVPKMCAELNRMAAMPSADFMPKANDVLEGLKLVCFAAGAVVRAVFMLRVDYSMIQSH